MTAQLQAPLVRATARNGIGYTALGLGILALITSPLLVGLLFGSLSITLGLAGLDAVEDDRATNRKSTIAAVILGVIASVIAFIALIVRIGFLICRFG
jgi:hypothetical protein